MLPSVVRYIVNGWSTTGLFQYRSGDPLTIFANSGNNSMARNRTAIAPCTSAAELMAAPPAP